MNKLTAGESFRIALRRENIKQGDIAKKLDINKQNISQAIRNFDTNNGSIKTLVEYAKSVGFDVEFQFTKKNSE